MAEKRQFGPSAASLLTSRTRQQRQRGVVVPSIAERLARREDLRRQREREALLKARSAAEQAEKDVRQFGTREERAAERKRQAAAREEQLRRQAEVTGAVITSAEELGTPRKAEERRRRVLEQLEEEDEE